MGNIDKFNEFYERIVESSKGNTTLIKNLTIGMLLLNPEFLDNVLDKGIKGRYTMDSSVFLNDLQNLLLKKNRFKLGIYSDEEEKYIVDDNISKANNMFDKYSPHFDIEKDWNILLQSRKIANNILEHLDITSDDIKYVFWIAPNKEDMHNEDLIIENIDGKQYPLFTNKKVDKSKSQSFNTFSEILIDDKINDIYSEKYMSKWNKLTQEWIRIVYENVTNNVQKHIAKFIDPNRIYSVSYFEYPDIKHYNKEFQYLGEYIEEVDKNILYLEDLLSEIYKREELFKDYEDFRYKWEEIKTNILKSQIIEHVYSESLKELIDYDVKPTSKYTIAENKVKMKMVKLLAETLDLKESTSYYFSKSGEEYTKLPSRQFFRDSYEELDVKYDIHVDLTDINIDDEDNTDNTDNDFTIRYDLNDIPMFKINVNYSWTKEMKGTLKSKMTIDINNDFNDIVENEMDSYIIENFEELEYTQYSFLKKDDVKKIEESLKKEIVDNIKTIQKIG